MPDALSLSAADLESLYELKTKLSVLSPLTVFRVVVFLVNLQFSSNSTEAGIIKEHLKLLMTISTAPVGESVHSR